MNNADDLCHAVVLETSWLLVILCRSPGQGGGRTLSHHLRRNVLEAAATASGTRPLRRSTEKMPTEQTMALSRTFLPSWRHSAFSCDLTCKKISRISMHVRLTVTLYIITFRIITRSFAFGPTTGTTNSRPCCPSNFGYSCGAWPSRSRMR